MNCKAATQGKYNEERDLEIMRMDFPLRDCATELQQIL